jgi:hypothetical protein
VGWALPYCGEDGAMLFSQRQAEQLQKQGNEVEIFSICRPEKMKAESSELWTVLKRSFSNVVYNILIRPYGILYTNPFEPLASVYDAKTTAIFKKFISHKRFDCIHFNAANPFELIEVAKSTRCFVSYTFHNFFIVYPHEHLFSQSKFLTNPCSDLTIYSPSAQRAVTEYQAYGTLPETLEDSRRVQIEQDFSTRLQYGKYLLEEVIDAVQDSHQRFLEGLAGLFDMKLKRVSPSLRRYEGFDIDAAAEIFEKKLSHAPIVFAELANIQRFKGQHILIYLADHLHDFDGLFEIRLYGGFYDHAYVEFLTQLIEEDPFRKRHIRFMGSYNIHDQHTIANDIHFHISTNPVHPYNSGTQPETVPYGVCPILKEDMLFDRDFSDARDDLLSYRTGDVKRLASIAADILSNKIDLKEAFIKNAAAMVKIEQCGPAGNSIPC